MDLTNPWMLPDEVFAWLETNLNPDSTVLELGSGQGTQRLCAMYRHVYSVEHDAAYLYTAQADYIYAPLDGIEDARWYNPRSLEDKLPKDYSFLLIDGPPGPTRANVAAHFPPIPNRRTHPLRRHRPRSRPNGRRGYRGRAGAYCPTPSGTLTRRGQNVLRYPPLPTHSVIACQKGAPLRVLYLIPYEGLRYRAGALRDRHLCRGVQSGHHQLHRAARESRRDEPAVGVPR